MGDGLVGGALEVVDRDPGFSLGRGTGFEDCFGVDMLDNDPGRGLPVEDVVAARCPFGTGG